MARFTLFTVIVLLCTDLCAEVVTALGFAKSINSYLDLHESSLAALQERWATSNATLHDLVCAVPKNRGAVNKISKVYSSPTIARNPQGMVQLTKRGIPAFSHCQVYVSPKWRFVYLRQPKSSSSTVMEAIRHQLCTNGKCTHEEFHRVKDLSRVKDLQRLWADYFVFTVVRNPWTRLVSAYGMFNERLLSKMSPQTPNVRGQPCGLPFEDFARNVYSMRSLCRSQLCCTYVPAAAKHVPEFVTFHIADQAHCTFLPSGEPLVDFIGATETIEEDWPEIVARINARSGAAFQAQPLKMLNRLSAEPDELTPDTSCASERVAAVLTGTSAYDLAVQFANDVHLFGYF